MIKIIGWLQPWPLFGKRVHLTLAWDEARGWWRGKVGVQIL